MLRARRPGDAAPGAAGSTRLRIRATALSDAAGGSRGASSTPATHLLASARSRRRHRADCPGHDVSARAAGYLPRPFHGVYLAAAPDRAGRLADCSPYRRFARRFQMNRYIMIRRLRGPAFLLLVGVLALLDQTGHPQLRALVLAAVADSGRRADAGRARRAGRGGGYPPCAISRRSLIPAHPMPERHSAGTPGAAPAAASATGIPFLRSHELLRATDLRGGQS